AGISLVSHLNYLSFYHWLKLAEIILFFLCLKDLADRKFLSEKVVILTLLTSGLFQSVLAISQFFKQSNLGLRILGESILSPTLAGVAKINLGGIKLIRAYGTFPHPSVLALFLFIIILFSLGYLIKTRLRQTKWLFSLFWLISSLFWLALFLTFSRTTIILALISVSLFLIWRKEFIILFYQVLLWLGLIFVLWPGIYTHFFQFYSYQQSISLRFNYLNVAWTTFWAHPWSGVGWGNFVNYFINYYPGQEGWFYQPVHNIYWLILSEVGIFGFLIFLWLIGKIGIKIWNIRRKNNLQFQLSAISFSIFLIIGLEDHFFLTTQQGWLLVGVMMLGVGILLPNRIE
ncbi:MAG TPA: O-antigen ligase domain-containing protein, partial [Candidatus Portnoybacteria bacterium]|nr:O-antigen ligase domain-containing protein [Candidatus Portnoybacteria bacterium]